MAVVAEYDRTEIYQENALLTAFGNPLLRKYLLRRNCTRQAVVIGDIGGSHIDILAIFQADGIYRVTICTGQRNGIHETGQHGIYSDFRRGQIEESLCLSRNHQHEQTCQQHVFPNLCYVHIDILLAILFIYSENRAPSCLQDSLRDGRRY